VTAPKLTEAQRALLLRLCHEGGDRIYCQTGTRLAATAYSLAKKDLLEKFAMMDSGLVYAITEAGRKAVGK
jgi:hypothetical protein